jgi:hypothetical protein
MAPRHFEFFEGAMIVALAGIDDPLEALEVAGVGGEGVGGIAGLRFRMLAKIRIGGVFPKNGFDAAHAAEAPLVVDEGVDEEALLGIGGAVLLVVFGGEFGEIFGGFVEHDLVNGADAVLEGVEAGCGLALGSVRTRRFLCVGAASRGLFGSWHERNLD